MPVHQNMITIGFAALFALVLAGCGNGSESPMTMEPSEPTEPPLDEDELARLQEELEALRAGLRLKDEADRLQEQIDDRDDPDGPDRDDAARLAWNNALWGALGIAYVFPEGSFDYTRLAHDTRRDDLLRPDNATDEPDPTPVEGWNGQSWSVTNSNNSSLTRVSYDNRGETPTPFNQRWGSPSEQQSGVYALSSGNRDHRTRIELSGLPTNPNHKGLVVGPVSGKRGTFDGVDGTFLGTSETGTEVKINAAGEPTWDGSNLKFRPDDNTATVMLPDATYAGVGLWLTENEDGSVIPQYRSWIRGVSHYDPESDEQYVRNVEISGTTHHVTTIPGTLTFKGPAVGHYAHRTVDATEGGAFVAEAEFVVDTEFGLSHIERKSGESGAGIITGTIDNFVGLDGQPIGDGWKIEIGNPELSEFDPTQGSFLLWDSDSDSNQIQIHHHGVSPFPLNARATFGDVTTSGHLIGILRDDSRNDRLPGGIEGTFDIGERNHPVRMAGAYYVVNQVPDLPDD